MHLIPVYPSLAKSNNFPDTILNQKGNRIRPGLSRSILLTGPGTSPAWVKQMRLSPGTTVYSRAVSIPKFSSPRSPSMKRKYHRESKEHRHPLKISSILKPAGTKNDENKRLNIQENIKYRTSLNAVIEDFGKRPICTNMIQDLHRILLTSICGRDQEPGWILMTTTTLLWLRREANQV